MRPLIAACLVSTCLLILPGVGSAKGCLKGAAVGGVVGHVAGHHAVVGAAAGCVIEHHREKEKDKAARQNPQSPNPQRKSP
jgi:phage tail tape-measure protein